MCVRDLVLVLCRAFASQDDITGIVYKYHGTLRYGTEWNGMPCNGILGGKGGILYEYGLAHYAL